MKTRTLDDKQFDFINVEHYHNTYIYNTHRKLVSVDYSVHLAFLTEKKIRRSRTLLKHKTTFRSIHIICRLRAKESVTELETIYF